MSYYGDFNWCCNGWGVAFKSKEALAQAIWDFTNNAAETEYKYGKMNCWDVRAITDMSYLFTSAFINEPIDCWDVGSVTNMSYMFSYTTSFNQPLDGWNVGRATSMQGMFYGANSFNQPLVSWNVGSVTDMSYMFSDATSYNQPLDGWNVGRVTTMKGMFDGATSFNQVLCTWYKIGCPNAPDFTDMFESNSCPSTAVPDCATMTSFCGTCTKVTYLLVC
jgi:surface protein